VISFNEARSDRVHEQMLSVLLGPVNIQLITLQGHKACFHLILALFHETHTFQPLKLFIAIGLETLNRLFLYRSSFRNLWWILPIISWRLARNTFCCKLIIAIVLCLQGDFELENVLCSLQDSGLWFQKSCTKSLEGSQLRNIIQCLGL